MALKERLKELIKETGLTGPNIDTLLDAACVSLEKMQERNEAILQRACKNGVEYAAWRIKRKEKKNANS